MGPIAPILVPFGIATLVIDHGLKSWIESAVIVMLDSFSGTGGIENTFAAMRLTPLGSTKAFTGEAMG